MKLAYRNVQSIAIVKLYLAKRGYLEQPPGNTFCHCLVLLSTPSLDSSTLRLYKGNFFAEAGRSMSTLIHVLVFLVGLFLLGQGLYAAVEAIIVGYSQETRPAFSRANLAI